MRVFFAPQVVDADDFQDLLARASFYLAHLEIESVTMVAEEPLPPALQPAQILDPVISERYLRIRDRLRPVHPEDEQAITEALHAADWVLLRQLAEHCSPSWQRRLAGLVGKQVYRVDKHRVRQEGSFYIEAAYRNGSGAELLDQSAARFGRLAERLGGAERAYVFGTGPSAARYDEFAFEDGFSIVCNTIVKDRQLMERVRPEVVCFADPIFHFGCSRYAARFRGELRQAAKLFDFSICIPSKYLSLFVDLMPDLAPRTIGVPMSKDQKINLDLTSNFRLRTVDNVLTLLLLPLAASLAREIHIIGCDGRPLEEDRYFWDHNPKTQLTELMEEIREVHPGFFDLDYNDYYRGHCANTERWIQAGEQLGRRFVSMVDSFVPALRSRGPAQAALSRALEATRGPLRVISVNPDLVNDFGHYLHHDLRCREELLSSGVGSSLSLAHLGVHGIAESHVVPWFSRHSWSISGDQGERVAEIFDEELGRALTAMAAADAATTTVFSMYVADHRHLIPILRQMAAAGTARRVFLLNLFYAHAVAFGDRRHQLAELVTVLRETLELRRRLGVHVCVDSASLRDFLRQRCGETLHLWPMFSVTDYGRTAGSCAVADDAAMPDATVGGSLADPLVAYYASNMQLAKGYDILAQGVERIGQRGGLPGVRFVARELYTSTTPPSMRAWADRMRAAAELVPGTLESAEYRRRMLQADVLLVPYRRRAFRSRTSGVISDAVLLGKPVVATAGTWCGDQVERFGMGVTFRDGDVEGFVRAVEEVTARYSEFRERAGRARGPWLDQNSPAAFVRLLREVSTSAPLEENDPAEREVLSARVEAAADAALGRERRSEADPLEGSSARESSDSTRSLLRQFAGFVGRRSRPLLRWTRLWVQGRPAMEARIRRSLWQLEHRGVGVFFRRRGLSLGKYLARHSAGPGSEAPHDTP